MTANSPTIQQLFDLTGKTALITGASGHLGSAMAAALAEAGARVICASRDLKKAQHSAASLGGAVPGVPGVPGAAGDHLAVALDHMDESSLDSGFDRALSIAGRIDILVSNGHDPLGADWKTVTAAQFSRQLANATGYFLLARRLHDHAVDQNIPASVILLGSMYGQVGSYPDAYEGIVPASPVAYHTLKGGILHMTRHLAVYWAKDNVRVNTLSPGPFPSEKVDPRMVERLKTKSPMGRMGRASELKGAVVFLASDASSYITGHNLVVDGGWTAW